MSHTEGESATESSTESSTEGGDNENEFDRRI